MDSRNHIAEAFEIIGGASSVARIFGVTPWAASKWLENGVPAERVISLAEATGWRKTPHQISPAIYPNRTDGVPVRARRLAEPAHA